MQLLFTIAALLLCCTSTSSFSLFGRRFATSLTKMAGGSDFYSLVEKDGKGSPFSFEQFRGRIIYGVNVASKCGYTASGYALLERLSALKEKGVECVLFPCNQFGGQEPGSNADIEQFCALKGVKGATVLDKADVNGANTRPTYKYLKEKGVMGDVSWNFAGAFIIDKSGNPIAVKDSKQVEKTITEMLGGK